MSIQCVTHFSWTGPPQTACNPRSSAAADSYPIMARATTTTAAVVKWNAELRAEVQAETSQSPRVSMHRSEWKKLMRGDPVEINPSTGTGFRVMTVDEWAARWKRNEELPACLACGSTNTKEHFFSCTWCRGRKHWESETLCLDCHSFSHRTYCDPDFLTPEEWDKKYWTELTREHMSKLASA